MTKTLSHSGPSIRHVSEGSDDLGPVYGSTVTIATVLFLHIKTAFVDAVFVSDITGQVEHPIAEVAECWWTLGLI